MSLATDSNAAAGSTPAGNTAAGSTPAGNTAAGNTAAGNTATPAPAAVRSVTESQSGQPPAAPNGRPAHGAETVPDGAVERALAAAIRDAARIGELLDVLRAARLWLPLPDDGSQAINGTAVTLPTVSYLGCDFVPAYSSAELLQQLACPDQSGQSAATIPHLVVRAADLARLLPPSVGIALNAGASESVPVYPQGVSYLAAEGAGDDRDRISVGPLPVTPDGLLASIGSGLAGIPGAREASAAWLSVQFAGEGLLISVTLDDPADGRARDAVIGVVERAAWLAAPQDSGFPIDVTFPGEAESDHIDEWISAFTTPFYRR
jgi:SseB protein N-terminal domain